MKAVEAEQLVKKFGDFTAVDGVSFDINEGEIFGFLGPNGAGKTTTLSMLATLLPITSGRASINGYDVASQPDMVRRSIGMVFQDMTLDEELTAYENMDFHGSMYGMPKADRKQKIQELLELVELTDRQDDYIRNYSGGMRRRLEIARGIMHSPQVLFLDEPTLGLDPQTKNHLWKYIEDLATEQSVTIILTTHYMEEADKLSDTIAIIDDGQIVACDSARNLKQEIARSIVRITSPQPADVARLAESNGDVRQVHKNRHRVDVEADDAREYMKTLTDLLRDQQIEFDSIGILTPTLEDVFLHHTGKTLREEQADAADRLRIRKRNR